MELGDTIEASDRVERLPLDGCQQVPVDDCDADVWRRCDAARFVLIVWYWANLALTSLSILVASCDMLVGVEAISWRRTFCRESMISAMGLSARYLTLFHWKLLKYCSTGSRQS